MNGVGLIGAIIVGGIAGWLAEKLMKSNMGVIANIIIGIVGAVVANWLLGVLHVSLGPGLVSFLIAGVIGACILIFLGRVIKR